eukprot:gene13401-9596_t
MSDLTEKTIVFNAAGLRIPRLDLYELAVPWTSQEGFYAFLVVFFMVVASSHEMIPLTMKIWLLCILWLIKLTWEDVQRSLRGKRVVIVPPPRSPSSMAGHHQRRFPITNVEELQAEALERISLVDCDISMSTVKIAPPEHDDAVSRSGGGGGGGGGASSSSDLSTTAAAGSSSSSSSPLLFRIEIQTNVKRWYLWRRYDDVLEVYHYLVATHGKEHVPRLKSLATLTKAYARDINAGKIATLTSMSTLLEPTTPSSSSTMMTTAAVACDEQFIQLATETLYQWFTLLQQLPTIRDDEGLRGFLQLPRLSAATTFPLKMDAVAEVPDSLLMAAAPSSSAGSSSASATAAASGASTKAAAVDTDRSTFSTVAAAEAAPSSTATVAASVAGSATATAAPGTTAAAAAAAGGTGNTNPDEVVHSYHLEDGETTLQWKGTRIDTFEFLDTPETVRHMTADRRYSHGFKVRGVSYMSDKKKIDADPALGRLVWYDVFPVDVELFGDRHDHAAAIFPMAQHRIRIIQSLQDRPFVVLVNYQIPGDPPLTGLAYFAIPGDFHPDCAHSVDLQKAKRLFERFVDLPLEDPLDRIVVPDLAQGKNRPPAVVPVAATTAAAGEVATVTDNGTATATTATTSTNTATVEVLGEAKILSRIASESTMLTNSSRSTGSTTTVSGAAASSKHVSPADMARAKSMPVSAFSSSSSSSSATATATTAEDTSTKQPQEPSVPQPTLGRKGQWKAVQPTKAWGADIAWANVGEPGVLDRKGFQNMRFKLVPQMGEAPWVVQMAVSSTPCLLGTKIVQRYFRGSGYLEIDLHIGSSGIANNVVGLCRKYVSTFVCHLGVVIQGEHADELPERVLMCMSMVKMQLKQQVAVTAPHVEHVHRFMRQQLGLPQPLVSPSAKVMQEEA